MKRLIVRKLLIPLMIFCSLTITPVKQAKAGVYIAACGFAALAFEDTAAGIGLMTAGVAIPVAGVWIMRAVPNGWGKAAGWITIVLDADGSMDQNTLVQSLANTYPFIDNEEALVSLAARIKDKVPASMKNDEKFLVNLSEEETRSIFESTDINESELVRIINDLK